MLGELIVGEDETVIVDATQRALVSWCDFLTAVDQPAAVPATS